MRRYRQRYREPARTRAVIVFDGRTFDVIHVYVNCSLKRAAQQFLQSIRKNVDTSYSDMREELTDMLDRYQFVETSQVTIGR